jgi:hypothetical protein
MEHRDPAIKAEMLRNEIEMIKANMKSAFAGNTDDLAKELAVRENELAALADGTSSPPAGAGVPSFDSEAIAIETESDDAADIRANIESVTERLAKTDNEAARALYAQDLADLKAELAVREKELAKRLGRSAP